MTAWLTLVLLTRFGARVVASLRDCTPAAYSYVGASGRRRRGDGRAPECSRRCWRGGDLGALDRLGRRSGSVSPARPLIRAPTAPLRPLSARAARRRRWREATPRTPSSTVSTPIRPSARSSARTPTWWSGKRRSPLPLTRHRGSRRSVTSTHRCTARSRSRVWRRASRTTPRRSPSPTTACLTGWESFLAESDGRPFILIGHSQGSAMLIRLDREPDRSQRVAPGTPGLGDHRRRKRPGTDRKARRRFLRERPGVHLDDRDRMCDRLLDVSLRATFDLGLRTPGTRRQPAIRPDHLELVSRCSARTRQRLAAARPRSTPSSSPRRSPSARST